MKAKNAVAAFLWAYLAALFLSPSFAAVNVDTAKTGIGYFTNVDITGSARIASGGTVDVYNTSPISSTAMSGCG